LEPAVITALQLVIHRQKERLLNVNIPLNSKGVKWTRQSVRHYDGTIVPDKDPRGKEHYWFTVTPLEKAEQGTDRWAVENGWTSVTPLRLDLTDESALSVALQEHQPADAVAAEPGHPRDASS
jgi:5'-nucleotidase